MSVRYLYIDRIEGEVAVLADSEGRTSDVQISELPQGAGEGDWLSAEDGRYTAAPERGEVERAAIDELYKEILNSNIRRRS